jgi:hypothetical protein
MSKKLVDLTQLTATAADDLALVVDVSDTTDSATGTSKKVPLSNLIPDSGISTSKMGGDVTAAGKALLTSADAAAQRAALGCGDSATHPASDFDAAGTASTAITSHVNATDPHPQYLTSTEGNAAYDALGAASSAVSAHASASDPHPQYLTPSEGNAAYDPVGAATSAVAAHVAASDPHTQYLTAARGSAAYDAIGAASSAISAHTAASDPHPQYYNASRGGAAFDAIGAGTSAAASAVSAHVAASNPHAQYITQSAADGRYILLGVLADGAYLSTMSPAFTGTQNATALTNDLTAAAGKRIVVPPGDYTLNAVNVSSLTIKLHFVLGARIIPDGSGGLYRVGTMIHFTNSTVEMENFFSDGLNNGSPICFRQDNGTLSARNTKIINFGPKTGSASTTGVYGFFLKGVTDVRIDGWTSSGLNDVRNSGPGISNAYGDQPGTTRHILFYNCGHYHLTNAFLTSGDELLGDDNDFIQFLDDQATVAMNGTSENVTIRYNGAARRCMKYQGGYHFADHIDIRKDSTFNAVVNSTTVSGAANNGSGLIRLTVASTANIITGNKVTISGVTGTTEANGTWTVTLIDGAHIDLQGSTFTNAYVSGGTANALTDVGNNNLNCVDWASAFVGFLRLTNSYVDATGFVIGLCNSAGTGGQVTAKNSTIIVSQINVIRHNLEHDADENTDTRGFYTVAGDDGSGLDNCTVIGGVKSMVPQGAHNFARACTFDDPRDSVFETGATGLSGWDFIGNKVITRTPGNLSVNGRCARQNDVRGVRIYDNTLEEQGNINHAPKFIEAIGSGATGWSTLNTAPAGTTPMTVGSSGIINTLSNNATSAVALSTITVDAEWNFGGSFAIWNFLRKQVTITGTTQSINQFSVKEESFLYTNASGCTITVPTAVPAGARWTGRQGSGPLTVVGDGTVAIVAKGGVSGTSGTVKSRGVGSVLVFEMTATNECTVSGDIAPNYGTLTDAATVAWNAAIMDATVTLANNRTLGAPTNLVTGGRYTLKVVQDATGSRTLAYNAAYKFPGGAAPTLSTGANAVDILEFWSDGTNMYLQKSNLNYS